MVLTEVFEIFAERSFYFGINFTLPASLICPFQRKKTFFLQVPIEHDQMDRDEPFDASSSRLRFFAFSINSPRQKFNSDVIILCCCTATPFVSN
jgi:hypothetical protein